jgi:hypothetical protein
MNDSPALGLPEAAHHLGVSVGVLRHAIRAGRLPAPPHLTATSAVTTEWLTQAKATVKASPKTFVFASSQKVPAFARYEGTSAWRKFRKRVRAYAQFQAASS